MKAYDEGQKKGYCYAGPHIIDGIRQDTIDPDPLLCKAVKDRAKKECEKLPPPDPSVTNQPVSGTTLYRDGKPVMVNGMPVIKGEVCDCTKE